jgi:hypothetical protein
MVEWGATNIGGEIKWSDLGNQDWSATVWGMSLTYAGARSGLFDWERNSGRFSSTMSLSKNGLRPLKLWRESGFDRLAKWTGYAVELQTGDAGFDGRIYLGSDDRALIEHLAKTPDILRAIERVLDSGVSEIWISSSQLMVTLNGSLERDVAIAYAVFSGDEPDARQLEVLTGLDWQGVAAFCLFALLPSALLGAHRARSHVVLLWMAVVSLVVAFPLQYKVLEIGANQLWGRNERLVPATIVDIRPDQDGLHREGYEAIIEVEGQRTNWELPLEAGQLARAGRLCVAAIDAEGLRTLRYVKSVNTWPCGPGEVHEPLPRVDGDLR